jgi:hypothetical protein
MSAKAKNNFYRRVLCLLLVAGFVQRKKVIQAIRIARDFPDNSQ